MEMTKIVNCNANNCVYNKDNMCHTMAVNIGDDTPVCDTFMATNTKAGYDDIQGGVGSCKVSHCKFNSSLECTANNISMVSMSNHVDCATYTKK